MDHRYVILERNTSAGSFFGQHPRQRKLISSNKEYDYFEEDQFNLRHDWNSLLSDDPEMRFTRYSDELFPHADDICRYFRDFADRFELNIAYGKTVSRISRNGDGRFHVRTEDGEEYRRDVLISALDTVSSCVPDDIPGIELTTPYESHSTDLEQYRNKSVNVPGPFFAGGAMRSNDSTASSGFIHGFRYNVRTLHHLLEERYEGREYPRTVLDPFDWNAFVDWMYQRFSVGDALFQMYGVLCDAVVVEPDGSRAEILEELPLKLVPERDFGDRHVLLLTLEFGLHKFREPSTTSFGPPDPTHTGCAAFLHPVVRHLHRGEVSEFHFGDSLLARWDRPHGSGGAVVSYHYRFQQWAIERLGLDIGLPEATSGGAYHAWSPEETEAWPAMQPSEPEMEPTCLRPF